MILSVHSCLLTLINYNRFGELLYHNHKTFPELLINKSLKYGLTLLIFLEFRDLNYNDDSL